MLSKISYRKEFDLKISTAGFVVNIRGMLRLEVGQLCTCTPRPVSVQPTTKQLRGQILSKISIVVPSFNQCGFIEATLQPIINQQHPILKLDIVDGGSTDNTVSIIKQYAAYISWWVSETDSGSRFIHQVADYFVKHSETQVVYGNRFLTNEDNLEIGRWVLPRHSNRLLKWADSLPQETLYWTRKAWNLIGVRLDKFFRFVMNLGRRLRLSAKQIDLHNMHLFLGLFYIHHQQKISNQMFSIGQQDIHKIHLRALVFQPARWQLILNSAPFLLAAKIYKLSVKLELNRNVKS